MLLPVPPAILRIRIVRYLDGFYERYQEEDFQNAIRMLAEWYQLAIPTVKWYEYIDGGTTGGQVTESGIIELQHPENWKRSKSRTKGKHKWTRMVIHEWGHYWLHAQAERKANAFERKFIRGTRPRTGDT